MELAFASCSSSTVGATSDSPELDGEWNSYNLLAYFCD